MHSPARRCVGIRLAFLEDSAPVHVYPVDSEGKSTHETEGDTCWCEPLIEHHPRRLVIHRSREQILDG